MNTSVDVFERLPPNLLYCFSDSAFFRNYSGGITRICCAQSNVFNSQVLVLHAPYTCIQTYVCRFMYINVM